jgi:hypothetical protein
MSLMVELLFKTTGTETVHHFNHQCKHPMDAQEKTSAGHVETQCRYRDWHS